MKEQGLYFIAIVFKGDLNVQINTLKELMAEQYNSRASMRSPPHITLHMPFKRNINHESAMMRNLDLWCKDHPPFSVRLSGFGSFPPRVIFISVILNDTLMFLQDQISEFGRKVLKLGNSNYKNRHFHPHVTIAFRDLRKSMYNKAWGDFSKRDFEATQEVNYVSLLKHNGHIWEVVHNSQLRGGSQFEA